MFDDLKDPWPPMASDMHYIGVLGRAHRIRRRQRVAMLGVTATMAAGVGALMLLPREQPSTDFAATAGSAVPTAGVAKASPSVTETAVPDTVVPDTAYPISADTVVSIADEPRYGEPSVAPPTVAVVTTVPVPRSTVAVGPRPAEFAAVTAAGEMVIVDAASGSIQEFVRIEPLAEGQSVETIALSPDRSTIFYSVCCPAEFPAGQLWSVGADSVTLPLGAGSQPALDPAGANLVSLSGAGHVVASPVGAPTDQGTATLLGESYPMDVAFDDDGRVLVLGQRASDGLWTVLRYTADLTTVDGSYAFPAELIRPEDTVALAGAQAGGDVLVISKSAAPDGSQVNQFWGVKADLDEAYRNYGFVGLSRHELLDPSGGWLLMLDDAGQLTVVDVNGQNRIVVPGTYAAVGW